MMKLPQPLPALAAVLLIAAALFAGNHFRLWRDTIFRSQAGGTIVLPSGHRLPTNQWIVFPKNAPEFQFLQIGDGRSRSQHVIQNHDSDHLATLVTPTHSAPVVVTSYKAVGPIFYREFWVGY